MGDLTLPAPLRREVAPCVLRELHRTDNWVCHCRPPQCFPVVLLSERLKAFAERRPQQRTSGVSVVPVCSAQAKRKIEPKGGSDDRALGDGKVLPLSIFGNHGVKALGWGTRPHPDEKHGQLGLLPLLESVSANVADEPAASACLCERVARLDLHSEMERSSIRRR